MAVLSLLKTKSLPAGEGFVDAPNYGARTVSSPFGLGALTFDFRMCGHFENPKSCRQVIGLVSSLRS